MSPIWLAYNAYVETETGDEDMSESTTTVMQDAIAAAVLAATQMASTQASAVAVKTENVPATMTRGAPLTMNDMVGGLSVDSWLAVSEDGLKAGKEKKLVKDDFIDVTIDLNAVQLCMAIKYGNPAIYKKTYDRVSDVAGGSWAESVSRAQRADPKAREYRSADVPMTLLNDVLDTKGVVLLEAGTTLGYSIPTTGWSEFEKFIKAATLGGFGTAGNGQTLPVKLGSVPRKNTAGNNWGVVSFTLLQA